MAVVRPSGGGANTSTPLSLRRSTINVENVVVRLWQSSTICLRANARSAFLFTGSPRFARDDKRVSTQSCTLLPPRRQAATPPMEGNLARTVAEQSSPLRRGADAVGGVVYHPKPWRRVTRVTPLSLRRSTINVENVGVRLWQSSAICLRAFARSAF